MCIEITNDTIYWVYYVLLAVFITAWRVSMANKRNILQYKRRPIAAVGVFILLFIYIVIFVILWVSKAKVHTYEVEMGSLMNNVTFNCVAFRQEEVFNSKFSGNVDYYQREGSKVMTGDTIYTVDETGRVSEILEQYTSGSETELSEENLRVIKNSLSNFKTDYKEGNFKVVYDLKTELNASVLQSINENIMANLDSIITKTGSKELFKTCTTEKPGIVVYSVDGYEDYTVKDIGKVDFSKENYSKQNLKSENLIAVNNPAFKLVTSENWTLMFPISDSDIERYDFTNKKNLKIKFSKDGVTDTFPFEIVLEDGKKYGKLDLSKYMVRYAADRFVNIEVVVSGKSGIKVPVSAITENDFYIIPKDFLITNTEKGDYGFMIEAYDDDNQLKVKFKPIDVYKVTDELVYVRTKDLDAGTSIVGLNSSEKYSVGLKDKLKGVYCVNTGYTAFKLVEIIDSNKEYYIVKQSVSHGISIYDRIILDADKFEEDQLIY